MPEFMLDDQNIPPPLDYETPPPPPPDDDPDDPIRSKVYSRHYSVGSNDPDRSGNPEVLGVFSTVMIIMVLCVLLIVGLCALHGKR